MCVSGGMTVYNPWDAGLRADGWFTKSKRLEERVRDVAK